jgi:transposase InsO family protein
MHAELADEHDVRCGRKRVARLMRVAKLKGVCRRQRIKTTRRDEQAQISEDLVLRQFQASAPNALWIADITYLPTWQGFLFLAVVIDAYSRGVVGWSVASWHGSLRDDVLTLLRRMSARLADVGPETVFGLLDELFADPEGRAYLHAQQAANVAMGPSWRPPLNEAMWT